MDIIKFINELIEEGFKPLSFGTTRFVLEFGDNVYKIALDNLIDQNIWEYFYYISNNGSVEWEGNTYNLAKCDLFYHKGLFILEMEKVTPILDEKLAKSLSHYEDFDSFQVGLTKEGKPVCFDYAEPENPILSKKLPRSFYKFIKNFKCPFKYSIHDRNRILRKWVKKRPKISPYEYFDQDI